MTQPSALAPAKCVQRAVLIDNHRMERACCDAFYSHPTRRKGFDFLWPSIAMDVDMSGTVTTVGVGVGLVAWVWAWAWVLELCISIYTHEVRGSVSDRDECFSHSLTDRFKFVAGVPCPSWPSSPFPHENTEHAESDNRNNECTAPAATATTEQAMFPLLSPSSLLPSSLLLLVPGVGICTLTGSNWSTSSPCPRQPSLPQPNV